MSDAAPAAPSATVTPITEAPKTHHSQTQPRADGKFNGPPGTVPPPAPAAETPPPPTRWKVGDEEFEDPAELARVANERTVDRRAIEQHYRQAQEFQRKAQELEAALAIAKQGKTLDAEAKRRIALEVAQQYQREQEEAALPEEQRAHLRYLRGMEERARQAEEKLSAHERAQQEAEEKAKQEADARQTAETRQNLGKTIKTAMEATGLPISDDLTRMVIAEMESGLHAGVDYPPEVLARRVQKRFYATTNEVFGKEKPEALLRRIPSLVKQLNALEDAGLLRELGPLGEKLRRLNLETSGLRPQAVGTPTAPPSPGVPRAEDLKPGDPRWADVVRARTRG